MGVSEFCVVCIKSSSVTEEMSLVVRFVYSSRGDCPFSTVLVHHPLRFVELQWFSGFYSSGVVVFLGNQRESKFDWNLVAFIVSLEKVTGKGDEDWFRFWRWLLYETKEGSTAFAWVAFSGAVLDAWCAVICFHDFSCAVIMLRNLSFYA